jgi:glycogen debranching enzyme
MTNKTQDKTPATSEQTATFSAPIPSRTVLAGGLFGGGRMMIVDADGFMPALEPNSSHGLWWLDTRHVQRWYMLLNGKPMVSLGSDDNRSYAARFWYANARTEAVAGKFGALAEQTIRIKREVVLSGGGLYERVTLINNGMEPADLQLQLFHGADFVDMFEVRGDVRPKRGDNLPAQVSPEQVTLGYRGLDGKLIQTSIRFRSAQPLAVTADCTTLHAVLKPRQEAIVEVSFATHLEDNAIVEEHPELFADFASAAKSADDAFAQWMGQTARVEVSNPRLQTVLDRALLDIYMLRIPTPYGPYVAAGIPWFYCPFGRDGIWTGLQMLPFSPQLAREILVTNCGYQGKHQDDWTLEDVGNIVHEVRFGEMCRLCEKPFFRYYGTVDATPLFIVLFCRYVQWTGDIAFARKYWRHLRLALEYVNKTAGRGYLAYGQKPAPGDKPAGLANRDWKDAGDSMMYGDGQLARPPIATCNVQAYLLQAWEGAAWLSEQLGYTRISKTLARKAARLKKSFARDYWMPEQQCVAMALDGDGRQCDVVSSNPGHVLRSGLLDAEKTMALAKRLQQPDMFSGWGVRTLATKEKRYNPDSYHNGTVWWHDNGIICDGMMEVGEVDFAHAIFDAAVGVAMFAPDKRLKELDSGTQKDECPSGPVGFPVACKPQLWAAGSVYMMLGAVVGLNRTLKRGPSFAVFKLGPHRLPKWLQRVAIRRLKCGDELEDVTLANLPNGVTACTLGDGSVTLRKTG